MDLDTMLAAAGFDAIAPGATSSQCEIVLRKLASLLASEKADALRLQAARREAVRRLQVAEVAAAVPMVQEAIKLAAAAGNGKATSGIEAYFNDPEPWPQQVEGAFLLDEIVEILHRYLVLPEGAAEAIALWVVHTWTFDSSPITPLLALCSPEKRCGKSTLLILLRALVRRPLLVSNITPAALFRSIEKWRPTLLIDEADSFLPNNEDLRGVLNSGHSRKTALVLRVSGDEHEPTAYSTWTPKAIAMIGRLPSTLEDRSVVVTMRRRAPGESTTRLRQDIIDNEVALIRQCAHRWAADNADALQGADPAVPPQVVSDRAKDNWRPLLAIAERCGGAWPARAASAASQLSGSEAAEEEKTDGVRLLDDIRTVFLDERTDRVSSELLAERLVGFDESPWPDFDRGRPITPTKVARLLKPFGIKPRKIRFSRTETKQGYERAWFDDAWRRYVSGGTEQPEQPEPAPRETTAPFDGCGHSPMTWCERQSTSAGGSSPRPIERS